MNEYVSKLQIYQEQINEYLLNNITQKNFGEIYKLYATKGTLATVGFKINTDNNFIKIIKTALKPQKILHSLLTVNYIINENKLQISLYIGDNTKNIACQVLNDITHFINPLFLNKIIEYLFIPHNHCMRCNRCNSPVAVSYTNKYSYQCFNHDEDLYEFETYVGEIYTEQEIKDLTNNIYKFIFKDKYMKPLFVSVNCMSIYNSSLMVPAYMSIDEAIEYAKNQINDIPLGTLEYVPDSDSIDEENCCFDD